MSYQAQTAVTFHSKQTNVKRLRLLMYLANGADASGNIDPAPNQDTLADFIGCSARTIRTMLNNLEADGELAQTRIGSGPGNPSAYKITLPMVEKGGNFDDKGGRKAEANTDIFSTFEAFKAEVKAEILELKAEILELKAEKVEAQGGKGGSERRKCLSTESADDPFFDPSLIQKEEESPPSPFSMAWFDLNGIPGPEGDEEWGLLKHPATAVWLDVVGRWPTYPGLRQITRRLGDTPNRETLRDVWDVWRASNYNLSNIGGVLDRYEVTLERAAKANTRASPAPQLSEAMTVPHTGTGW